MKKGKKKKFLQEGETNNMEKVNTTNMYFKFTEVLLKLEERAEEKYTTY